MEQPHCASFSPLSSANGPLQSTSLPWHFAAKKTEALLDLLTSNSSKVFGEVVLVDVASSSIRVHPIILYFAGKNQAFISPKVVFPKGSGLPS